MKSVLAFLFITFAAHTVVAATFAGMDTGVRLLDRVGLLSLIGLVSWPYKDPVTLLAQKLGIAPARLDTAGAGDSNPVATNKTLQGRALNRRVELQRTDR